jgi:cytoskeletal protein CcmA (bactofilin family)
MSWKQYGGIKHLDTNTNIRVNNIVSDSLILTSQISGDYNINGNLVVSEHSLLNDVSMNGNVVFNGNVTINGNLISSQGVFDENVVFMKKTYFGPDASNSSFLVGYNNNIGLNNTAPIATLDISGNKVSSLIVKSNLPYTKNIISQNINGKGISVATSDASSCIEFYNDNSIYGNSNAKIKYNVNGVLEIDVSNNTEIYSNVSISNRTGINHILNETLVVYDNSSGIYFKDVYNNPYSNTGNAASFISNDNSSNTFLNIMTPSGSGARFGGGSYSYDTSRAMNTFGISKKSQYIPSHTIVGGYDPVKYKTTTGINTYKPKVDSYVLDVNGPIHIENGEISIIYDVSFQITTMNSIKTNKQYIAAVGSSVDISGSNVIFGENYYRKYFICSRDGGITWSNIDITGFFNVEIQKVANNINDIFLYDTSSCFIVGDKQAFLYSIDGYSTFYRIAYPVNTNITNVYVCDLVSNTWRVWFSCSNSTLCYFDMSKNTIGNISPNVSINNLANNVKRLDGYGNYIYYNYNNVFEKRDINNNLISLTPVNKTFNSIYVLDENNVIGVGQNIISTTYDGGLNWIHTNLTGNFYKAYIFDLSNSIAIDNSYNLYYSINNNWNNVSYNLLNSNGMGDVITNNNNHFSNVLMTDINNILVSNTKTYYNYVNQYGNSNLFYMFLPNLFNRLNNNVIDICGNMKISGDIYINENGELKSTNSLFNLLNQNVNQINIGGDSTSLIIGNSMSGKTYIRHDLDVSGIITGYSDFDICANLFVNNRSVLNGDVSMNGNLYVSKDVSLNNNLYVNKNSTLNGDVSMNGNLYVSKDVSLNSNLYVNKDSTLNGNVYINSILNVSNIILNNLQVDQKSVLNGDVSMNSNLFVGKDVSLNSNLFVNQRSVFNGDVSMNGNLSVSNIILDIDNLNINGKIMFNDDVSMNGNLFVSKDVSLNSNLYVNQNSHLNGDVSMNGNLFVSKDVSLNNNLFVNQNSLLNGDVSMNGNLFVSKDISLNNNLFVNQNSILNGDVSMNGNLFVSKDVSLNNNLHVNQQSILNGDVSMNNNLFVLKDVSLNSNLYVNQKSILNGDVSMNGNLFVSKDVSLNSNLFVNQKSILNGDVSMNGNLFVSKDVSLDSNLFVKQVSTFDGNVILNNNALFNGNTNFNNLSSIGDASFNGNLSVNNNTILNGNVIMNKTITLNDTIVNGNLSVYKNFVVGNNAQEYMTIKLTDNNGNTILQPEVNFKVTSHFQQYVYFDSYTNIYSGIIVDSNNVNINKTFTCSSPSIFSNQFLLSNSGFDTNISSSNISLTASTGNISLVSQNIVLSTSVRINGVLNTENIFSSGNITASNMYATAFTSATNSIVGIGVNSTLVSVGSLTSGVLSRNEIRIGNYTLDDTRSSHIIIGGPSDTVDFYTTPTIISTITPIYITKTFIFNSGVNKTNTSFASGIFVSDNTSSDVSLNLVAFFAISKDMKAWNLKVPFGTTYTNTTSNVIGIRVNELVNSANINNSLVILKQGDYGVQGSDYNITNSNLDISNVFLKDIDILSGLQSVSTDVSMNGNLFVSNVCIGMDNLNNYSNSLQVNGNIYQTTTNSNGFIMQF